MNKLNVYLSGKNRSEFAEKVGTTVNYLNNLCSDSRYIPGRNIALRIEQATGGAVTLRELLFPDQREQNKG
jgi:DNA-binding transcriptional regulator YdaS (Cro superfamily)